jgi:hypothetical protein
MFEELSPVNIWIHKILSSDECIRISFFFNLKFWIQKFNSNLNFKNMIFNQIQPSNLTKNVFFGPIWKFLNKFRWLNSNLDLKFDIKLQIIFRYFVSNSKFFSPIWNSSNLTRRKKTKFFICKGLALSKLHKQLGVNFFNVLPAALCK